MRGAETTKRGMEINMLINLQTTLLLMTGKLECMLPDTDGLGVSEDFKEAYEKRITIATLEVNGTNLIAFWLCLWGCFKSAALCTVLHSANLESNITPPVSNMASLCA